MHIQLILAAILAAQHSNTSDGEQIRFRTRGKDIYKRIYPTARGSRHASTQRKRLDASASRSREHISKSEGRIRALWRRKKVEKGGGVVGHSGLLLELEIPVQLGLDFDDAIEKLVDDLVSVGLECLVEFVELLFGLLVYSSLRAGGGTFVL